MLRITVAMKVTVSPWEISGNVGQTICKLSHLAHHEKCHEIPLMNFNLDPQRLQQLTLNTAATMDCWRCTIVDSYNPTLDHGTYSSNRFDHALIVIIIIDNANIVVSTIIEYH